MPFFGNNPERERLFSVASEFYTKTVPMMPKVTNSVVFDLLMPHERGGARNYLIDQCNLDPEDIMVIMDSDVLVSPSDLAKTVIAVRAGMSWGVCYSKHGYYRLNKPATDRLIDSFSEPDFRLERPKKNDCLIGGFTSYASAIVMSAEFFYKCGGYDDRFRGWGYEDDAFRDVALTLGGEPWRPDNSFLIHMWHPEPTESTWHQPDIDHNKALYEEYRLRKGNEYAMLSYLEER